MLCDVGPDWVVTPDCLAARRGPRTRAAIVPHLYGLYADVDGRRALGLPIIEDCAQALGDRRQSVLRGDIAVLSFHPTKCLTTAGAACVLTADAGLARRLRALRDGEATRPGWRCPAPMSDSASALGRAQFSRYGEMLARRRVLAAAYDVALAELPGIDLRPALLATGMYRYVLHRSGGVERGRGLRRARRGGATRRRCPAASSPRPPGPGLSHVRPPFRHHRVAAPLPGTG
ncbi:MAG: DegT/DnrJ/EryC1/StrS family aminotransferase [Marmoricola sp.]